MTTPCTLCVVVPLRNEESVLRKFHRRLLDSIDGTPGGFEVLYVDDGSTDLTRHILRELCAQDARVGFIRLSRNFGKEQAISAGLRHARSPATIVIDGDLQDPPELIRAMLAAWLDGADVVNMRRRSRAGESWLKRATAHAFYRVMNRLSDVPIPVDTGDFRLLSRRAVEAINALPERNRLMKGLFAWIGFEQRTIEYDREPRAAGKSKWRYWQLWNLAIEGVTGFSVAPLKVATYAGLATALSAFLYAAFIFVKTLVLGDPVEGIPDSSCHGVLPGWTATDGNWRARGVCRPSVRRGQGSPAVSRGRAPRAGSSRPIAVEPWNCRARPQQSVQRLITA